MRQALRLDVNIKPEFAMMCIPRIDFKEFFKRDISDYRFIQEIIKFYRRQLHDLASKVNSVQPPLKSHGFFPSEIVTDENRCPRLA